MKHKGFLSVFPAPAGVDPRNVYLWSVPNKIYLNLIMMLQSESIKIMLKAQAKRRALKHWLVNTISNSVSFEEVECMQPFEKDNEWFCDGPESRLDTYEKIKKMTDEEFQKYLDSLK